MQTMRKLLNRIGGTRRTEKEIVFPRSMCSNDQRGSIRPLRTNNPAGLAVESCRTDDETDGSTGGRSVPRNSADLRETADEYF